MVKKTKLFAVSHFFFGWIIPKTSLSKTRKSQPNKPEEPVNKDCGADRVVPRGLLAQFGVIAAWIIRVLWPFCRAFDMVYYRVL